ncbi:MULTISPECIES: ABC transporter ATP-binding protein [unclassified Clostridioides]|uniref:ABC transporter ATP-binding protein n=1 Tax=unclassified Clostridioides TaxID=2635829 RepID=UPI001D1254BD|nr:ATP-binding cassette domain-containing protein [Clostridioides sp. ZZV14-6150]MCC0660741.1 ATP-binding cassette domain-containing protein [Clostridioides sp. ZZV14-6154]MCC0663894.1 ATP-binding cassette domain-containing protein [Clostridioides sp. ZZV15-6597]MCC0668097.1 ATP-binding cassette domain-containing protein [Clostridioides sp. ZZV14-6153]MCC0717376.1 ATP-binding cassette domain-containing protein [Clostridioides sp. ZZV14-6105]MCC0721497.1 ATP-binding cassette domain-containing p
MSYLKINNVFKSYDQKRVLNNISLDIEEGEFLCLLGPSGCGKTTLLRIIAGLEDVNSGAIILQDKDITDLEPSKRGFGIVFQSYALFPNMTAYNNIAFPLKERKVPKEKIDKKVREVLETVGLSNEAHKYPKALSGGQQQRIAIARALALEPKFLLLDEPMSALDAKVRHKLRMDIKKLQKELNITTIMVTHDQEEAITMADKIAILNGGDIMQIGTPEEIYQNPQNLFTAQFIGDTNCFDRGDSILTVRPEYVQIEKSTKENYHGTISNIEFRGNLLRVEIKDKLNENFIISDVSIKEWVNLNLVEGDFVSVSIDEKYYLKYPKVKGA